MPLYTVTGAGVIVEEAVEIETDWTVVAGASMVEVEVTYSAVFVSVMVMVAESRRQSVFSR